MLLPNAKRAFIDPGKIRDYLLSPAHPVGRFKAVFFRALGFTEAAWMALRDALLAVARLGAVSELSATTYGRRFEVRGTLLRPNGRAADVVTGWIVRSGEDFCASLLPTLRDMFNELDTVVLDRDLLEHGLRRGDLGAIVAVHSPDALEVEFVAASGRTQALVTLTPSDVRAERYGDRR